MNRERFRTPAPQITRASTVLFDNVADLRGSPALDRRRLDLCYLGAASPAVITWADLEVTIAFEPTPAPARRLHAARELLPGAADREPERSGAARRGTTGGRGQ